MSLKALKVFCVGGAARAIPSTDVMSGEKQRRENVEMYWSCLIHAITQEC